MARIAHPMICIAVALAVCATGCNAFDDRPPGEQLPTPGSFDTADPFAPPPISSVTAPTARPVTTEARLDECLGQPGIGTFTDECAGCICDQAPEAVLMCGSSCFNLLLCVVEQCANDGSDIGCITTNCADFLNAATEATELGNVLMDTCGGVCAFPPRGTSDGCAGPFILKLGAADEDAGSDCGLSLPIDGSVDPDQLVLELDDAGLRRVIPRVASENDCDGDGWVDRGPADPLEITLCPVSCSRAQQGALFELRVACSDPFVE